MIKNYLISIFLLFYLSSFSQVSLVSSVSIIQSQEQSSYPQNINNTGDAVNSGIFNINSSFSQKTNLLISPNPSNNVVHIAYSVISFNKVSLSIFNQIGQEIISLVKEYQKEGNYSFDSDISKLLPGIYFIRLNTGKDIITKKLIIN